jgi:hypothetical protein
MLDTFLSRRDSRRQTHKDKEKALNRLARRHNELAKQTCRYVDKSRLVPLAKPIFAGFKKEHILRADIAKSVFAEDALKVLPYLSRTVYSRRKDFLRKNKKAKRMEEIPHNLKGIGKDRWDKDKLDQVWPLHLRSHFQLVTLGKDHPDFGETSRCRRQVYRFDRPWWFDVHVSRYYFTHERIVDGAAESEYAKLNAKLEQEHWWEKSGGTGRAKDKAWNPYYAEQDPLCYRYWEEHTDRL